MQVLRPLITSKKLLRILFLISFISNGLILLVLLTTLTFPEKVFSLAGELLHRNVYLSHAVVHVFFSTFSFLFFVVITGLLLMTKNKKAGYIIYFLCKGIIVFFALFVVMNIANILFTLGSAFFLYMYRLKYLELKKNNL